MSEKENKKMRILKLKKLFKLLNFIYAHRYECDDFFSTFSTINKNGEEFLRIFKIEYPNCKIVGESTRYENIAIILNENIGIDLGNFSDNEENITYFKFSGNKFRKAIMLNNVLNEHVKASNLLPIRDNILYKF